MWQTIIHFLFILSAIGIAFVERISASAEALHANGQSGNGHAAH